MPRPAQSRRPDLRLVHRPVVRTVAVDDPVDLLGRLPSAAPLAWVSGGEGLVGWGEAARFEVGGAERFSRAQRWWTDWCARARVVDDVDALGTGPVAFASFAFDPHPGSSVVVVPRVVLGRRGGRAWLTAVGGAPGEVDPERPVVPVPPRPAGTTWSEGTVNPAEWESRVLTAVSRIRAGALDKVVLARDVLAHVPGGLDVRHLLGALAERYPGCWTFSVDGLVGATPELLVRRTDDVVTSRVLAGTVRRRGEARADAGLARELLASGKDLAEHEYAVHSVSQALAAHCTDLDVPARPHVLRLHNVQHLATDVTGRLADGSGVLGLAASLHPTAAVCGTPTERAMAVIRELEGMDRGRYAGPVGWIDSRGDGELGIALRCASVSEEAGPSGRPGTTLRLFAGCGIVAESDPAAELAESNAKLAAVRDALEG